MQKTILVLFLCLCLQACNYREHAKALQSQSQLEQAQTFIDRREFFQAEEMIGKAIKTLDQLLVKESDNVDYLLLRARAHYLFFLSKNITVMERAAPQANSLVKIPQFSEYIDFELNTEPAKKDLQKVLILQSKNEQRAVARTLLGNLLGLDAQSALDADEQYQKAIFHYKEQSREIDRENKIGKRRYAKQEIQEKIKSIMMSRAEVLLLAQEWKKALAVLQEHMAGNDLKYFSVHFTLLENKIHALEKRLEDNKKRSAESREAKLSQVLEKIRQKNPEKSRSEVLNPIELELLSTEEQLTETKNNLIYRMICYFQIKDQKNLKASEEIFRSFYPQLHKKIKIALEQK